MDFPLIKASLPFCREHCVHMLTVGREVRGELGESRKHRGFRERQSRSGFSKVGLTRLLHAVRIIAVGNSIEVELENFVLRVALLELAAQDVLAELACDSLLPRPDQCILRKLLSDGGTTGSHEETRQYLAQGCTTKSNDIEAAAFVETLIFNRNGCLFDVVTDLCKRDEGAILDRKSTRLNSSHSSISYAVFCLKK